MEKTTYGNALAVVAAIGAEAALRAVWDAVPEGDRAQELADALGQMFFQAVPGEEVDSAVLLLVQLAQGQPALLLEALRVNSPWFPASELFFDGMITKHRAHRSVEAVFQILGTCVTDLSPAADIVDVAADTGDLCLLSIVLSCDTLLPDGVNKCSVQGEMPLISWVYATAVWEESRNIAGCIAGIQAMIQVGLDPAARNYDGSTAWEAVKDAVDFACGCRHLFSEEQWREVEEILTPPSPQS